MRTVGLVLSMCTVVGCSSLLGLGDDDDDEHASTSSSSGSSLDAGSSGSVTSGGSSGSSSSSGGSSSSGASSSSSSASSGSTSSTSSTSSSGGVDGGPLRFAQIAAGTQNTCALTLDGTVACAGSAPGHGQSTESGVLDLLTVVRTEAAGPPLAALVAVGVGNGYACALSSAPNRIWCWGSNGNGNIGDGTSSTADLPQIVVDDPATKHVVSDWDVTGIGQIAVGSFHACARHASGHVYCWGRSSSDQLGIADGSGGTRTYAVPVVSETGSGTLDAVTQVAVGADFSCALRTDTQVYCWGSQFSGSLGDGLSSGSRYAPSTVRTGAGTPLTGVTHLAAGGGHACAVTSSGHLFCWGKNSDQQLGVFVGGSVPARALYATETMRSASGSALDGIVRVSAGTRHTCAVENDGDLWCWGSNATLQLGNGSAVEDSVTNPGRVLASTSPPTPLGNVATVAASNFHSAALDATGTAFTWGDRALGRDQDSTTVALPIVELGP